MISKLFGSKASKMKIDVAAPVSGELVPLQSVPDEAFAQGLMGDGVAIEPSEGLVVAPFDGVISHLIDTHHAVIVEHASGLQLLIHIGINTVALKGEGYKALVQTGDTVKSGQPLIEFNPEFIRKSGYSTVTPIIVVNEDEPEKVECSFNPVTAGDPAVLSISLKSS
ncbi:PTS sugar transporter subunit IIA [Paenibacillus montanisoli]|uniref:PTS glucose transporter subunit IIA n=1 Tax=Paenibacillus montanisoli TaxID=2081970 RepID=A0A328U0X1_9BACL|nr:PTS glucose transporter subunit IIA [Paenibacillus montanisoli]RAP76280.1 PTS glucose transporter subunit IIA [Paenibacillus montanisoli]